MILAFRRFLLYKFPYASEFSAQRFCVIIEEAVKLMPAYLFSVKDREFFLIEKSD